MWTLWIANRVTIKQGYKSSGTKRNLVKMCRDTRDQAGCMTGAPPKTIHSALAASQDTLTRSDVYNRFFISGIIEGDIFRRKKWHVLALNCYKAPRDKHVLAVDRTPASHGSILPKSWLAESDYSEPLHGYPSVNTPQGAKVHTCRITRISLQLHFFLPE